MANKNPVEEVINSVEVKIDGKEFTMSGTKPITYYKEVGRYINHKIAEIKKSKLAYTINLDFSALILAINVVSDYFAAEDTIFNMKKEINTLEKQKNQSVDLVELEDSKKRIVRLESNLEEFRLTEELYLALKEEHENNLASLQEHKDMVKNLGAKIENDEKTIVLKSEELKSKFEKDLQQKLAEQQDEFNLMLSNNEKEHKLALYDSEKELRNKFEEKELQLYKRIEDVEKRLRVEIDEKSEQRQKFILEKNTSDDMKDAKIQEQSKIIEEKNMLVKENEMEIKMLQDRNDELSGISGKHNIELSELIKKSDEEIEDLKKQVRKLKEDNFKLNEGFTNINEVYKANQTKIKQLEEENNNLQKEASSSKEELDEYIKTFDNTGVANPKNADEDEEKVNDEESRKELHREIQKELNNIRVD